MCAIYTLLLLRWLQNQGRLYGAATGARHSSDDATAEAAAAARTAAAEQAERTAEINRALRSSREREAQLSRKLERTAEALTQAEADRAEVCAAAAALCAHRCFDDVVVLM
jgi:molybdopterin-biosynthesis enzyme MoeA-like protein